MMLSGLNNQSDAYAPMVPIEMYPMANSGYLAFHVRVAFALWRYHGFFYDDNSPRKPEHIVRIVAYATDCCGNELAAMITEGTPLSIEVGLQT
jgi:hypothetical protein